MIKMIQLIQILLRKELRIAFPGKAMALFNGLSHFIMGVMGNHVTVDQAGRIVLPKLVRDELQLSAGDKLELKSKGEEIVLRPVRHNTPLHKERGIWIYRTGRPLTAAVAESAIRQAREERADAILGRK